MRVEKGVPQGSYNERRDFEHSDTGKGAVNVGKDATTAQRGSGDLPDDEAMSDEEGDEDDIWQRQQSTSCALFWVRR
jgi:hypothetical protein